MRGSDYYKGDKKKLSEEERLKRIEKIKQEASRGPLSAPQIIGKKTREDLRGGS